MKTDQTGWMPRLICVFAGRTCHFVGLSCTASSVSLKCELSSPVYFKSSMIKMRKKNEDGTVGQHTQKMIIAQKDE